MEYRENVTPIILKEEKDQLLTTNCWITQIWTDHHLRWNTSDFDGIDVIRVPYERVWKPDIILYNKGSGACVRINGACTDWFDIRRGVRQECVASPWQFNLFMDSYLYDLKEYEYGLRMDELSVEFLLYADDQVIILALSACGLQEIVNIIYDYVNKRGMKVNVGKTKVMVFERGESTTKCNILIEAENVEQVKGFVYLGSLFANDGKHDRDIERRVNEGNKLNEALFAIMNRKSVSQQACLTIDNGVLIPIPMYDSES
ncbi:Neuronal acetylcholine receptor subunit alpha-3 [Eumeta japonica]|uniref:Neuronal acetylcholine receptor subunit alpha-3 n=1 Tax=Eumeta variegata TaxID=151549 RepID=A0A4C1XXZ7_EUMVA|nr:Neuronal acetylcholine receptor subunit alpha-3 [Eumeta japonica]